MTPFRFALAALLVGSLTGCAYFRPLPEPSSLDDRLSAIPTENLPLRGRTVIYWDRHQIPFVEAEHDEDAAFALGLVQAHLRLGHMELARRISQGRLSELLGETALDVDHAIRTFDFDRAVPAIEAALPPETRRWLEAYIAGVNHYLLNVQELPQEFRVLGMAREPWTLHDFLTFSRLASSDATWPVWISLLRLREQPDWPEIWAQLVEVGSSAHTTFDGMELDDLNEVLGSIRHSGSNAVAIAPSRSRTGAALFAADPHVGYIAPTIWLLAGLKSPSYHVVGVMPTGVPFFALGRNPEAAWGGTNLYAVSSSFYDVSSLDDAQIRHRIERIRVGSSREVEVEIRETPWGPILSDLPPLEPFDIPDTALRWMGHLPSDEVTAMLAANRATRFEDFRAAFASFAVSGMNMLYADTHGDIGQIQAVTLPRRPKALPPDIIRQPAEVEPFWQNFVDATSLPALKNPAAGYVATANNKPPEGEVPVGLLFSTNDRIGRINALMGETDKLGVADLEALQQDVYMASSVAVRDAFLATMAELRLVDPSSGLQEALLNALSRWDGHYRAASRGALAYELLRRAFVFAYYLPEFGEADISDLTSVIGGDFRLRTDLEQADRHRVGQALRAAIGSAAEAFDEHADWGSVHRLRLVHPFVTIPLVGSRYQFGDVPIGGSLQTLMKSAHNQAGEDFIPHHGATARFIADLSDLDHNYFVLVGGQDGWLNSSTFLDQMPLFLAGDYIQLPLRLEEVRTRAVHVDVLR